jgi:alkylation response protein AidB-like acyl-CoA dehydrogenase
MYPGLTHGAADLLEHFALDDDRKRFLPPMLDGRFSGTMCLSEPHAGSDVGATRRARVTSRASVYAITGTKCWISAGRSRPHDNIVHLVLARIEGAPAGTKGLSLFIVPKIWVDDDGSLGEPNDVTTASIEHKLGIRASATAVLSFGDNGRCRGILVGGRPHEGMRQMFRMMNGRPHRRRRAGDRGGLDRLPQRARLRARAAAGLRRSRTSRTPTRPAWRSSSTPTSAACCSR